MANPDQPKGFTPVRALGGGPWTALMRKLQVGNVSADGTNNHGDIYVGDPIAIASGKAVVADSGDTVAGVVVGVGKKSATHGDAGPFDPTTLDTGIHVPYSETSADSDWYVWYVPSEFALFEIQTASDLDLVVGSEADTNVAANTAHGSRTTGMSTCELTTNSNSDIVVVEQVTAPDNDVTAANARHIVRFRAMTNLPPFPAT